MQETIGSDGVGQPSSKSDYFNSWLAVSYLYKNREVGIQEYICNKMKDLPLSDIEFLLPQLVHLLVTRINDSISLEFYLLDICKKSAHTAVLTLWYLESYLKDYKHLKYVSHHERVSQLLSKFQTYLFESHHDIIDYVKIWPNNIGSLLVGMSCVSASICCSKILTNSRLLALKQGSIYHPQTSIPTPLLIPSSTSGSLYSSMSMKTELNKRHSFSVFSNSGGMVKKSKPRNLFAKESPSLEELSHGRAFSFQKYISKSRFSKASINKSSEVLYTPSPSIRRHSHSTALSPSVNEKGAKGNWNSTIYYYSEIQFLNSLLDISSRLSRMPKESRNKALEAELNLLNHNLPANVCIPLWCSSKYDMNNTHHKVVRISPNDAVILNSAERVPYLIMVEVIEDEKFLLDDLKNNGKLKRANSELQFSSTPHPVFMNETDFKGLSSIKENIHDVDWTNSKQLGDDSNVKKIEENSTTNIESNTETSPSLSELFKEEETPSDLPSQEDNKLQFLSSTFEYVNLDDSYGNLSVISEYAQIHGDHKNEEMSLESPQTEPEEKKEIDHAHFESMLSEKSLPIIEDFSEKMRTAAILLAQLQEKANKTPASISPSMIAQIRSKIIQEMEHLELQRMTNLAIHHCNYSNCPPTSPKSDYIIKETLDAVGVSESILSKEDPSALVFKENWNTKIDRIRKKSPFGTASLWKCYSVIVKADTDLRQEQLALQLIYEMKSIWALEKVNAWVHYYKVLIVSDKGGLVETISDTISLHSLKKEAYVKHRELLKQNKPVTAASSFNYTLKDHFVKIFGTPETETFKKAQECFMASLVGYSMVTYILCLKDRHNGNILLDKHGHIVHIDFGFMLSNSPGGGNYVSFENAPFKFTQEYIELLDGFGSALFLRFKKELTAAFLALRKYSDRLTLMIECMVKDSRLPCFGSGEAALTHFIDRFMMTLTEQQIMEFVNRLIASSSLNMFTRVYDTFQYYSNGIL